MKLVDCYRLLGLREGASHAAVKAAYRRLARQYHPDANPGDLAAQEQFVRIAQAYEQLIEVIRPPSRPLHQAGGSQAGVSQCPELEGLWNVPAGGLVGAAAKQILPPSEAIASSSNRFTSNFNPCSNPSAIPALWP